jgi:ABC-type transport system substrate-binding protein
VRWNRQRIVDPEEKMPDVAYDNIVEAVEVLDAHTLRFTFATTRVNQPPR